MVLDVQEILCLEDRRERREGRFEAGRVDHHAGGRSFEGVAMDRQLALMQVNVPLSTTPIWRAVNERREPRVHDPSGFHGVQG